MQQLQEVIKKDLISHPLRNIEIIYEAGKTTLTTEDRVLITGYTALHHVELELKNTARNLHRQAISVNETIQALHEELIKVRTSFDSCCNLADKLSQSSSLPVKVSLEKLEKCRKQTEKELKDYHDKILALYEAGRLLQEGLNQYEPRESEAEDLYEEFASLVMKHAANWESNTINTVAFDSQFDQFREYTSLIRRQRENLILECESAITNYTSLNNESTALYKVWNEFHKRCELLTKLYDLHNVVIGFTEN